MPAPEGDRCIRPTSGGRPQAARPDTAGDPNVAGATASPHISDHAADAAASLEHLGVRRAHVAGHSTAASIGTQLALDHPERHAGVPA